tara:strand:- start:1949 stop:2149 length:201 start_codon:yes stop_codon:yes gene_type:complete
MIKVTLTQAAKDYYYGLDTVTSVFVACVRDNNFEISAADLVAAGAVGFDIEGYHFAFTSDMVDVVE